MHSEARIEPLDGKLPKVSYRWDPETDILSVACKGTGKANGLTGTVDLEGADGSFVVIDVQGGVVRGVDVVTWPDDIRTIDALAAPEPAREGRVVFPSRRSQPGIAAVEDLNVCTYADARFFSYRRATLRGEPDYGRQLSVIVLEG